MCERSLREQGRRLLPEADAAPELNNAAGFVRRHEFRTAAVDRSIHGVPELPTDFR